MRRPPLVPLAFALAASLLAACNDDGGGSAPDSSAMAEAFDEVAAAAYEAEDVDRDERFAQGLRIAEGCPGLDAEAIDAITAAMFGDEGEARTTGGFIQGVPGESEIVSCPMERGDQRMAISYGTTLRDLDQTEAAVRRSREELEVVDVEVPGLPEDSVVVLHDEEATGANALWVGDGFFVGVTASSKGGGLDRIGQALAEAVDQLGG